MSQTAILVVALIAVVFAISRFIIPAAVGTVKAELKDPSTLQLIKQNGHLLRSGWRFWFTLLLVLTGGSGLLFAVSVYLGNGGVALKAAIVCLISCVLMLLVMRKLP